MPEKKTIGRNVKVDFINYVDDVPAKIDTGADGSAVWASDIFVDKENFLHFKLFGKGSPYYTGEEVLTKDFSVVLTKSASGQVVMKYLVKLSIQVAGKRIRAKFGLSNRSTHNYPVLIGRRTLMGKFIVDVSKKTSQTEPVKKASKNLSKLNKIMKEDPYKFYKEHYLNENGVK